MANVFHVYVCGHFDSNTISGSSTSQYVFVDGPCSAYLCKHTDPAWFREQGKCPDAADMAQISKWSSLLVKLRIVAKKYAHGFTNGNVSKLTRLEEAGYPGLLDLAFSDDRWGLADSLFHMSTLASLLKYARQFSKSSKTRPFFDFCTGEITYFFNQAGTTDKILFQALVAAQLMYDDYAAFCDDRQWPGSIAYHEREFGQAELALLHASGPAGQEILAKPFSAASLHVADALIRSTAQYGAPINAVPQRKPSIAISPSPPSPPESPPTTASAEFMAWLKQEEKAFVAQRKSACAAKAKVNKQRVVKRLKVSTQLTYWSQHRLPSLVRAA